LLLPSPLHETGSIALPGVDEAVAPGRREGLPGLNFESYKSIEFLTSREGDRARPTFDGASARFALAARTSLLTLRSQLDFVSAILD